MHLEQCYLDSIEILLIEETYFEPRTQIKAWLIIEIYKIFLRHCQFFNYVVENYKMLC